MLKKLITIILVLILTISCVQNIFANSYKYFYLDGKSTSLPVATLYYNGGLYMGNSGIQPLIIDNRMYIAATDIMYLTDSEVSWEESTQSVVINTSKGTTKYNKGGTSYTLNGVKKELGGNTKFYIVNSKSMIPVSLLTHISEITAVYDVQSNSTSIVVDGGSIDDLINGGDTGDSGNNNTNQPENPDTGDNTEITNDICTINVNKNSTGQETISVNLNKSYDIKYFSLDSPSRYVVDIYGFNGKVDSSSYKSSAVIDNIETYYHSNEDKFRITFNLKSNYTYTFNGSTSQHGMNFTLKYEEVKNKVSYNYSSDRVNSSFSLNLNSNYKMNPTYSSSSRILSFTIPKDNINLVTGKKTYSDRNVSYIDITDNGSSYNVNIGIKSSKVEYKVISDGNTGKIQINFVRKVVGTPTVVIDAGHGGNDPGTLNSAMGIKEKDLNLNIALKVAAMLRAKGYNVIETRTSDKRLELVDRAYIANNADADLFISIHHNSATSTASGIETMHHPTNDNKAFATIMQNSLISYTGARNRGLLAKSGYVVLNSTKMPAVIAEAGFISNTEEATKLLDSSYQQKICNAIVNAVDIYFER